jgi:hypothetical protein
MADPTAVLRACEHRRTGTEPCGAAAAFRVALGRRHDAQLSCRRHLAATVDALCGEDRDTVAVEQIPGISHG